jgi:adenylylsulfate kinase-like enzyme
LPGSGKTSIANKLKKPIEAIHGKTILFSGDDLRRICNFKSYDKNKRLQYAQSYSKLVKNLLDQNINVIIATVALIKKIHLWNRKNIQNYCEIYIKSKTDEIIKQRMKKLYSKHKKNLVGIDILPEFPSNPDIKIHNNFKKPIDDLS